MVLLHVDQHDDDPDTRLFPSEWAGTDSRKEVDEKSLVSLRSHARYTGSTASTLTLDPSSLPDKSFDAGAHAQNMRYRYGYSSDRYSPNGRDLSYISISKGYAPENDETESDNRGDNAATAGEDATPAKPIRLQYATRSNVAYIPEAYHNWDAACNYTGVVRAYNPSSQPMFACGKQCFNPKKVVAKNKSESAQSLDDSCTNSDCPDDNLQKDPGYIADGVSDVGVELYDTQMGLHRQPSLVLKKVTLQNSTGEGDATRHVSSTTQRPASANKGAKPAQDKQKPDSPSAKVPDQQNRESRSSPTKTVNGSLWPYGKHDQAFNIRDLFPAVDKVNVRRSFPLRTSRPLGSVAIDDSSQRETKFLKKERLRTDTGRSFTMREGIEHLRQKELLQVSACAMHHT